MKQTTDELKKIIENAPEDATHYCDEFGYWMRTTQYLLWDKYQLDWEWVVLESVSNLRSLDDIEEIIELRERLENAAMYLDSFIDTEQDSNMLPCYDCGCVGSCEVDFTEAYKALGMLKGRN